MLVSIITPIKNGVDLFSSTFDSVISQTYESFEWFIVDDESDIDQLTALSRLVSTDSRVSLLINDGLKGPGPARNLGLKYVKGSFICFIDSDDLWGPNFLQTSINTISQTGSSFVFSGYRRLVMENNEYLDDFIPFKQVNSNSVLSGSDISCLTAFISAELLDENTLFGNIPARNDLVFFYRVLLKTDATPIPKALATYRIKKMSVSSNKFRALRYQYVVNRVYAQKSVLITLRNLIVWLIYGLRKYYF